MEECEWLIGTISGVALIIGAVLSMVVSGIGVTYFRNELVAPTGQNMTALFGCGIAMTICLVAAVIVFLVWPDSRCCPYVFGFPFYVLILGLYMGFTAPSVVDHGLDLFDERWNASQRVDFQFKFECCGWYNASDRGLLVCPFEFENGCRELSRAYSEPRFKEVFVGSLVALCLLASSVTLLHIVLCCAGTSRIAERVLLLDDLVSGW